METAATIVIVLYIFLMIFYFAYAVIGFVEYILRSLSLGRIMNRRGISGAWMCWLPITMNYAMGKIAAEHDERNGHRRKWGAALLTLTLITVFAVALMVIMLAVMMYNVVSLSAYDQYYAMEEYFPTEFIFPMVVMVISYFICIAASVVNYMCHAVCIFKIFESTVPEKALKYFIISLIVPLGMAICLMKSKEGGYTKPVEYYAPMMQGGQYYTGNYPVNAADSGSVSNYSGFDNYNNQPNGNYPPSQQ